MRSNLLLIAGEHYNRRQSSFFRRIRDAKELNEQQKIRLTKNHIQKIAKTYVNNIISLAPGVGFLPKNESERHDQKAAELHHAVWQDAKDRYGIDERVDDWCDNFIGIGEVALKIFWDANLGPIKGHMQALDPETGAPQFDEMGMPVKGEPVHVGGFILEEIYGFNLLRAPEAKRHIESPYHINRKMVNKDLLTAQFPDKKKGIQESYDQTLVIFTGINHGYQKTKNEVLVKEYYFRPCPQYPNGYYYIATKDAILSKGELPGGVYPIVVQEFDKIQTTARGRSCVRIARPYQAEINRAASKMAEHQITLGDDKLLIQNGTKISAGVALPGVRSINFTGQAPDILAGRDGSQYLNYMNSQIAEMYDVMNVKEGSEESNGQTDPFALLFKSASQKKKFVRYVRRFERFLVNVAKTYMSLAKTHLPDDTLIMAVGRKEQVNMSEFKNSDDISYEIKVEAQSDDIETKFGKQLILNHALQYVGSKLDKEDIGKIMRAMPYGNFEESFDDMTIDYDASNNIILALDRGEQVSLNQYDNNVYMIKRLVSRMRQADFKFLDPQIQQQYVVLVQQYQASETQRLQDIKAAESEFIPTDGYLVTCQMSIEDPSAPNKTRQVRLPYSALQWLIKMLETQGQSLGELEKMNQGALAQMAQGFIQKRLGGQPEGMGNAPQPAQ
jgi:hypothetical protein